MRDLQPSRPRQVSDALLNLLYPDSCFICRTPVARQLDCGVCGQCWARAQQLRIAAPWCSCCGLPFQGFDPGPGHLCSECITDPPPFSAARSFGYYEAELSRIVLELKFRGRRVLSRLLGPLLQAAFLDSWHREEIDLIVPVPLHRARKRERGFNQSELMGRELASLLVLPLRTDALRRSRNTPPQVGLSDPERLSNVRGVFGCGEAERIRGKRVLLVDDVMTTGATVRSAAETLLGNGALRVAVLTVARAVPHR
jgi:ComF family protein